MNERIKELAKQADVEVVHMKSDHLRTELEMRQQWVEMFAELIIQECINCCDEVAEEADAIKNSKFVTDAGRMLHEGMWGGATNSAVTIKNRFGVEW